MNAKDCCDILTQAGIRPTSTRILVYEAIAEEKNTFSLGDLEERLPSIDKSGLFRTLTLFHDHRLIHSVDDGSGSLKYCFCHNHGNCREEEEHCHFYCEECRKTYCLDQDLIPHVDLPEALFPARSTISSKESAQTAPNENICNHVISSPSSFHRQCSEEHFGRIFSQCRLYCH